MQTTLFACFLLIGALGSCGIAQKLRLQKDEISEAFNIGFLAMAPKVMCADTTESVFITLTNMTRPIEVRVQILDGPNPEDVLWETPIRLVGTPCACMEMRAPPSIGARRVVTLRLLARRTDLQCDDWEVTVKKKVFIDACAAETFIETDKPVYIAGQKVKFRVLTLRSDLRPDTAPVKQISIEDPNQIPMIEWNDVPGSDGLIQKEFQLSNEPPLGQWRLKLHHHGRSYDVSFQVDKYELPRFELIIEKPSYVTIDTPTMKLKVCARYPLGQAVPGSIEVKIGVKNQAKVITKKKRPVLTFKNEDTGVSGCYDVTVDLQQLELCSNKYVLADARLRMTIIYTDIATGVIIKEIDTDTIVSREPFHVTFDASPVYKPGLPYHGRLVVRYPDDSPAAGRAVTLTALGDNYGIYEEVLTSDEEGIVNFLLPEIMYEIREMSLRARSTYTEGAACNHPKSYAINPPQASFTVQRQYSPSGSFIQILPINDRVKINSLQTITIYFVTQKPESEGINFHVMFMSRGNILKSTEVFIFPEDYDGYKHPGAYLPIPVSEHEPHAEKEFAEAHIGPIDTPVSLPEVGEPKVTHRKFKISSAMSPLTSVIVYYVRRDNEVVSEMVDFKVEEVFDNEVKMNFEKATEEPRSLTKVRIRAAPGSLCAFGVVDRTIHLMGEQNRITKKKVFNQLAKMQLSAEGGYAGKSHKCGDMYKLPVFNQKGNRGLTFPHGMIEIPGFGPERLDASITFMNMGIVYLTNLNVETSPCPKYKIGAQFRDEPIFGAGNNRDTTFPADAIADVTGKTIKIKSFFPETWLWEIKVLSEDRGEAEVNVLVPDRITTWVGRGFCTNPKHGAGVSDLFPLRVYQPYKLELELPPSVIRGEKIPVTVIVFEYLTECMVVKLSLKKSDDYTPTEVNPTRTVCVCNGMPATATFYITPNVIGQVPVEVYGLSVEDNIKDSVCGDDPVDMFQVGKPDNAKKPLTVEGRGVYVEEVFSSYFCPADYSDGVYEERILLRELPAAVVPGTVSATVTVSGDMITPTLSHLEKLLRLPLISGEQNLLQFAPNVYILRYLKTTRLITPKIEAQAIANMVVGYQRQETFRRKDGSYVVFRNDLEGSSWLTAFTVRVFAFASQFMSVDVGDLEASVNWLRSLQDVDTGCFQPTGRIIHRAMRGTVRDEVTLTAYVMSAMMEAGINKKDPAIMKGMECLDLALNGLKDVYTAALMSYTFALADKPCLKKTMKILNALAIEDHGSIHWETSREDVPADKPYLHRKAAAQDIELTSYVLLSYTLYREDTYVIYSGSRIAHWIINQFNSMGGFASSQDTMVALQALAEYARVSHIVRRRPTNINVKVQFGCEKTPREFGVTEDNRFTLQTTPIPIIPEDVIIDANGVGCAMTQVIVKYNIIPEVPRRPKFILRYQSESIDGDCNFQKLKICSTYNGDDRVSNLAVISLRLISGYSADVPSVEDLRKRGLTDGLKSVEINGKNIEIFVDKFTLKQKCFNLKVRKEFDVSDAKKGVITVYDYYEPSRTVSSFFSFGCDNEAENDEVDPKQGVCPVIETDNEILCNAMCQDDSGCEGSQKCCSNGCGQMCMLPTGLKIPPTEAKYGSCPFVAPSINKRICQDKCDSDNDCSGIEKCCRGPSGCNKCYIPSELNPCPMCLAQLPSITANVFCNYDFVVSGKLLKNGEIKIKRDLKTNKRIKLPVVKRILKEKCACGVLKTRSLVLLMFNNRDLDLETKTLSFEGNSIILKLTAELKTSIQDLHTMCRVK